MLLARVVGEVWGARQADNLTGHKLLVVEPLAARPAAEAPPAGGIDVTADAPGLASAGSRLVAIDALGAGPGELVLVAHGSRCRDLTFGPQVPTKDVVVAIVDAAAIDLRPRRDAGGAR